MGSNPTPSAILRYWPSASFRLWMARQLLVHLFPALRSVGIRGYVAGVSTYTPDGLFLSGAVPGIAGLYAVTGCCGAGIAASGGLGQLLAAMALGEPPGLDPAPFAPGRFGSVDPCRHYSGAPLVAFTLWRADQVRVSRGAELLGRFNKAGMSERRFCTRCGGHVMIELAGFGFIDVYPDVLPGVAFQPSVHLNYAERVLPAQSSGRGRSDSRAIFPADHVLGRADGPPAYPCGCRPGAGMGPASGF